MFRKNVLFIVVSLVLATASFAGTSKGRHQKSQPKPSLSVSGRTARREMKEIFRDRIQFTATVKEVHMPTSWHRIVVYDDGSASYTNEVMDFYKGHGGWEICTQMHGGFRFKVTPSAPAYVPTIKSPAATDFMVFYDENPGLQ